MSYEKFIKTAIMIKEKYGQLSLKDDNTIDEMKKEQETKQYMAKFRTMLEELLMLEFDYESFQPILSNCNGALSSIIAIDATNPQIINLITGYSNFVRAVAQMIHGKQKLNPSTKSKLDNYYNNIVRLAKTYSTYELGDGSKREEILNKNFENFYTSFDQLYKESLRVLS